MLILLLGSNTRQRNDPGGSGMLASFNDEWRVRKLLLCSIVEVSIVAAGGVCLTLCT